MKPSQLPQLPFWSLLAQVIHRYATWFSAPFVAVAAFTALLYIATPQLEQWYYRDVLSVQPQGSRHALGAQVILVQSALPRAAQITAVRPASTPTSSTRVLFYNPQQPQLTQAMFVDPYRLKILGQYPVYGTSGLLPLRTQLDHWHRDLGLGIWGRWYSELAATWLGILLLSGIGRYFFWRHRLKSHVQAQHVALQQSRRWHALLGLWLLPFLIFVSVTGLTWSTYAGQNILQLRQLLHWQTPSLNTQITALHPSNLTHLAHEQHSSSDLTPFNRASQLNALAVDDALKLARRHGVDAARLQIKVPATPQQAWVVQEIDQRWPTQVDSIALDLTQGRVVDQLKFDDYPLVAKLIRWGIDAHIGVLFGGFNQLLLLVFALALLFAIGWGYRVAYIKQRHQPRFKLFYQALWQLWQQGSALQRLALGLLILIVSLLLPLLGFSLILACVVALAQLIWQRQSVG